MPHAKITALNVYPVKSCRGIALERVQLTAAGLAHDRRWLIINETGRFQTQRELPRISLIKTQLDGSGLKLSAHGMPDLAVPAASAGDGIPVMIWDDRCSGIDAGPACAAWLSSFLNKAVRLVSFDAANVRRCDRKWVGDVPAQSMFADAFPLLVVSEASLENLNHRLSIPVPMNRFRPNIVLSGIKAHDEDRIHELSGQAVRLRIVKPCTRCAITTTDQATGRVGEEPMRTLKSYRWDPTLRGVTFGQNAVIVNGIESVLRVGQELQIAWA